VSSTAFCAGRLNIDKVTLNLQELKFWRDKLVYKILCVMYCIMYCVLLQLGDKSLMCTQQFSIAQYIFINVTYRGHIFHIHQLI
jgi:hypothetical protein